MNEPIKNQHGERKVNVLAVISLFVAIIFVAWLAIQFVRILPDAFMSLVSLADRAHNPPAPVELEVASSQSVANAGTTIELTWSDLGSDGVYIFEYDCAPGVSLDITADGETTALACSSSFELPANVFTATITVAAERERFNEVTYRIAFIPADDSADVIEADKMLTVVNADIPLADAGDTDTDTDAADTDEPATDDTDDEVTTTTGTEQPVQYRYVETVTYSTPVSDPNGYTDLAVTFLGIGTLTNSNVFIPATTLEEGEEGAFRFEVKNIGTKTSSSWTFDATLPSGEDYESKTQGALKPQERVVVTVAFDSAGAAGAARIDATVDIADATRSNNEFSWSVLVD